MGRVGFIYQNPSNPVRIGSGQKFTLYQTWPDPTACLIVTITVYFIILAQSYK